MGALGMLLKRFDIILLYENNPKLFEKMIPYIEFSEERDRLIERGEVLGID